ncbi:MAG: stage II sporulation protein P, partial [Bacilli bacterium]
VGRPCADNLLKVIEKLEYIRELELDSIVLNKLHSNKINRIYDLGKRYEPYEFRLFKDNKRHAMLSIFLLNLSKDLTDKAFEIHDRVIQTVMSGGRKAQDEIQKQNDKKINEKDYARILFIIGLENPRYQENLKLTEQIKNDLENYAPGITRGIYKKEGKGVDGVYNQDVSPKVILVEMGGNENTIN